MGEKVSKSFPKDLILIVIILGIMFFVNPAIGSILFWMYIIYKGITNRDMLSAFMANRAYRNYQYSKAIDWYKKAALSKVSKAKIIANYVFLELKHGDVNEADRVFIKITTERQFKEKDFQNIKMAKALIYWKKNDVDSAIKTLQDLSETHKTSTIFETLGYFLINKGDLNKALEFNETALITYGSSSIIKANLGEIYYSLDNFEKAKELFTPLIDDYVNFSEPYYYSGLILAKEGNKEAATELLNRALSLEESFLSNLNKETIKQKLEEISKVY
ncbi:hypothetical protein CSC2_21880 [Clostridium zeae]|uniref:Tetratricopeptide repeat protein n=1 Tax=Clostridium zeae TaxID=2759022 RepID=A0ABQ1EA55_9CLOT|nr:tetratricopeptide repeat protein [Clostridium zeae]GFZ31662.1 hypothetical protein CSC2_21880 [Clostridium zeae]